MGKAIGLDMLSNPSKYEVEAMLKAKREHDLSLSHMATISGIKGKQFGREVFTTVLKFKDLMDFLQVFPDVQRDIVPRRVSKIKMYVLSGVENPYSMRFFSGITVTARGNIFYDESQKKVAIDTRNSKLSINDGQHRFYGISEAIRELQGRINKVKDKAVRGKYRDLLENLKEMVIPIVIFNNLTEEEEKQLFHDLNNLAQRPSRNATIRLAQTDIFSRLARELAESNRYLKHYGIEFNKMSIKSNNPNTILLTTVYAITKLLYWYEYKKDYSFINEDNYEEFKAKTNDTLNEMFYNLPPDIDTKGKYVLEKNYALKGIAKFIHHARHDLHKDDKEIFEAISKVKWEIDIDYWGKYGAFLSNTGLIQFSGNGEGGITSILTACVDNLNKK